MTRAVDRQGGKASLPNAIIKQPTSVHGPLAKSSYYDITVFTSGEGEQYIFRTFNVASGRVVGFELHDNYLWRDLNILLPMLMISRKAKNGTWCR